MKIKIFYFAVFSLISSFFACHEPEVSVNKSDVFYNMDSDHPIDSIVLQPLKELSSLMNFAPIMMLDITSTEREKILSITDPKILFTAIQNLLSQQNHQPLDSQENSFVRAMNDLSNELCVLKTKYKKIKTLAEINDNDRTKLKKLFTIFKNKLDNTSPYLHHDGDNFRLIFADLLYEIANHFDFDQDSNLLLGGNSFDFAVDSQGIKDVLRLIRLIEKYLNDISLNNLKQEILLLHDEISRSDYSSAIKFYAKSIFMGVSRFVELADKNYKMTPEQIRQKFVNPNRNSFIRARNFFSAIKSNDAQKAKELLSFFKKRQKFDLDYIEVYSKYLSKIREVLVKIERSVDLSITGSDTAAINPSYEGDNELESDDETLEDSDEEEVEDLSSKETEEKLKKIRTYILKFYCSTNFYNKTSYLKKKLDKEFSKVEQGVIINGNGIIRASMINKLQVIITEVEEKFPRAPIYSRIDSLDWHTLMAFKERLSDKRVFLIPSYLDAFINKDYELSESKQNDINDILNKFLDELSNSKRLEIIEFRNQMNEIFASDLNLRSNFYNFLKINQWNKNDFSMVVNFLGSSQLLDSDSVNQIVKVESPSSNQINEIKNAFAKFNETIQFRNQMTSDLAGDLRLKFESFLRINGWNGNDLSTLRGFLDKDQLLNLNQIQINQTKNAFAKFNETMQFRNQMASDLAGDLRSQFESFLGINGWSENDLSILRGFLDKDQLLNLNQINQTKNAFAKFKDSIKSFVDKLRENYQARAILILNNYLLKKVSSETIGAIYNTNDPVELNQDQIEEIRALLNDKAGEGGLGNMFGNF